MLDPSFWFNTKSLIVAAFGISRDALHILSGLIILVTAAALLRTSLAQWRPWLVLLALALANEAYDLLYEIWPGDDRARQWDEAAQDLIITMLSPTMLLIFTRLFPTLFDRCEDIDRR